ncbi:hypothetical protein [Mesorhizobium sp.]|uniref:hypothetical protein n=1 Tax=Mesorhizobium sp. TaxID=1871066 RepID=UPI000FE4F128|nr:hypothetical protein [Mesorhizobium sp.]RWC31486.1 MAG: hypothetical protein EOS27_09890 [Mesorhizobium sp.]RWC61185.1 MAG: hypothetical protein EOS56_11995 [Mesorhizobium sp.]RWC65367.1 MAG: hypothetical protein EOS29_09060 [Mesorhizobium sp.]
MIENLDTEFGELRGPERIMKWEEDRTPNSLCTLDAELLATLSSLRDCAQSSLLKSAAQTQNYLWVMDASGSIKIAIEEIAVLDGKPDTRGFPRRRGYKHPSEDKKLGHPTLLAGGKARIAGELALDLNDDKLLWVLNANSGRYCKQKPPSKSQVDAAANLIQGMGLAIKIDYL